MLAFGVDRFARVKDDGSFKFKNLAQGEYDLCILSTLVDYGVLDTVNIPVITADTTDLGVLELPFIGIPVVKGLSLEYDTLKQIVTLSWDAANPDLVKGYNVYRKHSDSDFVKINAALILDTTFSDSSAVQDQTYEYKVVAVAPDDNEGEKGEGIGVEVVSGFPFQRTIGSRGEGLGQFDYQSGVKWDRL